jgi:hypothetical protein
MATPKIDPNAVPTRLLAGGFVAFVLIVAADFDPVAPVAVGFAYLFLLSTLLIVGPAAFANVQRTIGAAPAIGSAAKERGGK